MERIEKDSERIGVVEPERPVDQSSENQDPAETDTPPEFCHYRDEGCELSQSCLHCPFPRCVYDRPWGRQKWVKNLRDREIERLYIDEKRNARELAARFNITPRTVLRALAAGRKNRGKGLP